MTDVLIRIVIIVSALLYYVCFVFSLKKVSAKIPRTLRTALYASALILNAGVFVYNYASNVASRGASFIPFVSVYQCLVFLALCFFFIRLFIEKYCRITGYAPYFLLASAIVMTGPCFMKNASTNYPPALQSVFFIPHILFYMTAYSLAAVGALIALRALIKKEDHDRIIEVCARMLFPFMTAGLFCGAVWADQVWGEFWAWDIKECWSLVTWLNYTVALHLFRRANLRKIARILMITGILLVVVTFFFSNVLKVPSVHSY